MFNLLEELRTPWQMWKFLRPGPNVLGPKSIDLQEKYESLNVQI